MLIIDKNNKQLYFHKKWHLRFLLVLTGLYKSKKFHLLDKISVDKKYQEEEIVPFFSSVFSKSLQVLHNIHLLSHCCCR